MFGLVMLILYITARIVVIIIDRKKEVDWKKKAIRDGDSLWVDRYGTAHHVEDDAPFVITTDYKTHDVIEKNPYTGETIRNLTKEDKKYKKDLSMNEAIQNGLRLYSIGSPSDDIRKEKPKYSNDDVDYACGRRWVDRFTDRVYVRRKIGITTYWYIDLETGLYAFPDDSYINDGLEHEGFLNGIYCKFEFTDENVKQCLRELNEKQVVAIHKDGLNSWQSGVTVWHNEKVV